MSATAIEWTDHSINPLRLGKGHFCQKISTGCANCYSSNFQKRFGNQEFGGTGSQVPDGLWLDESKLQEVLRRKKPTKYFWCDMTDMFGDWVPNEWLDRCFATMALTPQHTHQVLTKRPERMRDYMTSNNRQSYIVSQMRSISHRDDIYIKSGTSNGCEPWPPCNVWLGTSVENQEQADKRIPILLQTPAAIRFLSIEPMLGPIDLRRSWRCSECGGYDAGGIILHCSGCGLQGRVADWCIAGGESGPNARPMHPDWARSIRDQCQAAGVPFFFKQWGCWSPYIMEGHRYEKQIVQSHTGGHLPMWRVGKKAAGRLLEGIEHNAFPERTTSHADAT